ncbi:MAG: glycosyltransferase family 2 protein [Opitutaceae bacterium]|nr:glycosyltransferase family 2 protein [Opitutaceae bacterium]
MSLQSIAVIVRSCGREILLNRTMESIASQTLLPAEIILVGLGQKGRAAAEAFRSRSGVKVLEVPEKRIRGGALNDGVEASYSRWITFLDDDDTWNPHFLSEMARTAMSHQSPSFGALVCRTEVVYEKVDSDGIKEQGREQFNPWLRIVNSDLLYYRNRFTINAAFWSRDVVVNMGGFSEELGAMEDWEFNRRASRAYEIRVLPRVLARYHRRPANDLLPNSLLREHDKVAWCLQREWLKETSFFGPTWHRRNVARGWAALKRLRVRMNRI